MRTRIRCPWHDEKTASLVRRKFDWHCYGACSRSYTHAEVEARLGEKVDYEYDDSEDEKEDLEETFKYIDSLPKKEIRGVLLPHDEGGYFVCWPNKSYYKYRRYTPGKGPKYVGGKGIKPPLFWSRSTLENPTLYIVEGELNALSVAKAVEADVCSPGSASMFNSDNLTKYWTIFRHYHKIVVVLDDDPAGIKGLIEAKAFFSGKHPFVDVLLLKPDPNEILVNYGAAELRERLQRQNPR